MSFVEEHREIAYIIGIALVISMIGIMLLGIFSYKPPEIGSSQGTSAEFKWGEVYDINNIKGYKYELINIYDDSLERASVLYYKTRDEEGNIKMQIITFDEIKQRDVEAFVVVNPSTYNCIKKYFNGKSIECSQKFGDSKTDLGEYALPTLLDKNDEFSKSSMDNIVYNQKYFEAVKLETQKNSMRIYVWVAEGISLPARIEIVKSDGSHIIANLKSYN